MISGNLVLAHVHTSMQKPSRITVTRLMDTLGRATARGNDNLVLQSHTNDADFGLHTVIYFCFVSQAAPDEQCKAICHPDEQCKAAF
jgi:hypothetical protein